MRRLCAAAQTLEDCERSDVERRRARPSPGNQTSPLGAPADSAAAASAGGRRARWEGPTPHRKTRARPRNQMPRLGRSCAQLLPHARPSVRSQPTSGRGDPMAFITPARREARARGRDAPLIRRCSTPPCRPGARRPSRWGGAGPSLDRHPAGAGTGRSLSARGRRARARTGCVPVNARFQRS
jgi:hypothetical protein